MSQNELLVKEETFDIAKQRYDLVFYFSNPRSSNFLRVKRMLKKADAYMENNDTKEYCAFFMLEPKNIPLIRKIHLAVYNWKSVSVFLKGCESISLKDYAYWFDCFLDSFLANTKNYCRTVTYITPYRYFWGRLKDCVVLPCHCNKYEYWANLNDKTSLKEQYLNYSYSGIIKCAFCPKFDISVFEELMTRKEIEKNIKEAEKQSQNGGCFPGISLTIEVEQKKNKSKWFWIIILILFFILFISEQN